MPNAGLNGRTRTDLRILATMTVGVCPFVLMLLWAVDGWATPFQYMGFNNGTVYRVNVGSTSNYTDTGGNIWYADRAYDTNSTDGFGYSAGKGGTADTVSADITSTTLDPLYASHRWGAEIEYRFDVPSAGWDTGGIYEVMIRIIEPFYHAGGQRVFNIYFN